MEARKYLKKIKDDGWYLHDTDGSTRQYVHRKQGGFLTACVRHGDDLGPETETAALKPGEADIDGLPGVVIETTAVGCSGYSPDLPGVVATGKDEASTRARLSEAIRLHRRALQGEPPEV